MRQAVLEWLGISSSTTHFYLDGLEVYEMNSAETTPAGSRTQAILPTPAGLPRGERTDNVLAGAPAPTPRHSGYGLPCAKCKTYYAADLAVCPVCKSAERVSPNETAATAVEPVEQMPDPVRLEEERERFLQEFQSKALASPLQIHASESYRCDLGENHHGGFEPAAVCRGCYDNLLERANLMEAALHIELQEAAAIVYEAVWADPTDTSKTYSNAAQSLLNEIQRRAGIGAVLGPLQPLRH